MNRPRQQFAADDGIALVSVMGWIVILMIFMTVITGYALNGLRSARTDQNWHAALGAAEAGLDDFLYRLNQDTAAWQPDPTLCTTNPDDARCGFVPVPGGAAVGEYTYAVDSDDYVSQGVIRVTATGRVGERTRTVEASYRRENFLDYVYFTEFETVPLWYYERAPNVNSPRPLCARHEHGSPARPTAAYSTSNRNTCIPIRFVTGDVMDGPFRTNDTILLEGSPRWDFEAISANPRIGQAGYPGYNFLGASASPVFPPGHPRYGTPLVMPPSNDGLRDVARYGTPAAGRGCVYEGPTRVVLRPDGQMTVTSPRTATGSAGPGCPNSGATGALPANGVIYVDNSSGCTGSTPHPLRGGIIPTGDTTPYGPCAGDLFIEGTVRGHLTAAAANDIIITWHLQYARPIADPDDLIGLAAQGDIWIFRPMDGARNLLPVRGSSFFRDPQIDAAILSVKSSFAVQNVEQPWNGPAGTRDLGTIRMRGAIVQIFRGPVGTGMPNTSTFTGYLKDYRYDWRLQRLLPPFFIEPVAAQFNQQDWAERPAQP